MIKKEFIVFLVVGSLTVLVDFLVYQLSVYLNMFSVPLSKGGGFIAGTIFAYFANKFFTFGHVEHSGGSVVRFILLYSLTLTINIGINSGVLYVTPSVNYSIKLAFIAATFVSALLNFVGMKFFVFRECKG